MARCRLGAVLLLPEPLRSEVKGLRRGLGAPSLETQPPHLTLVPPVNVRVDDLDAAVAVLRRAADRCRTPIELRLGPVASFAPVSSVVYLQVAGATAALDRLSALRDDLFVRPLWRSVDHAYVPHVTLNEFIDEQRILAALAALQSFDVAVTFDRVHLLMQDPTDRVWRPFADYDLTPPIVRGRSGVELHLRWTQECAPDVGRLWSAALLPPSDDEAGWLEARDQFGELLGVRHGADAAAHDSHLGEGIEERLQREPFP